MTDCKITDFHHGTATRQLERNDDFPIMAKVILAGIGVLIFGWVLARGIDTSIENKDRMLCRSAKVSGNEEWLKKCECFYQGEPITCI